VRGVMTVLVLLLVLMLLPAVAPSSSYGQAEPQVLGKTIGEWSADWWQWLVNIPAPSNLLLDTTGQFSGVNQKGPVWFLVGALGTDAIRTATVPAGKHILFPIGNWIWVWFPGDSDTEAQIRTWLDGAVNSFLIKPCTLDGVPILFNYRTPTVRSQSPAFPVKNVPQDNVFGVPIPPGSIGFADGFWVVLPPLSRGMHVLQFGAEWQEVTYNLKVLR
jgi:hypothetical protein